MTTATNVTTHLTIDDQRLDTRSSVKIAAIAGQDIPNGLTTSAHRSLTPIINMDTVFWKDEDIDFIIEVTVNKKGKLVCTSQGGAHTNWLNFVRLARHCHMQNSQIVLDGETMRLQVVKPISKGEPLYAWFTMDTAKIFHIPFLSPKNILDGCHYSCHRCGKVYEDPNPLKVHMAFHCPRHIKSETVTTAFKSDKNSAFQRVLPNKIPPQICIDMSPNFVTPADRFLHPAFIRTSPFYQNDIQHCILTKPDRPLTATPLVTQPVHVDANPPSSSTLLDVDARENSATDAAEHDHREQPDNHRRHKCFYCGKLYSRKYGLKIHIRTHTGYKPLKCKVCLRPFGDPSNLNKHVRLHAEGVTPYKCQLCGKVLVRRRDLERHLRSRHPASNEQNITN